jgi:hypothetical protein
MAAPVVVFGVASKETRARAPARATVQAAIVEELRVLLDPASPLRLRSHDGDRPLRARDVFILTFTNAESHAIGRAFAAASAYPSRSTSSAISSNRRGRRGARLSCAPSPTPRIAACARRPCSRDSSTWT